MDGLSFKWGLKNFCFCLAWTEERPAERWWCGLAWGPGGRGQPGTEESQELSKEKGEKEFWAERGELSVTRQSRRLSRGRTGTFILLLHGSIQHHKHSLDSGKYFSVLKYFLIRLLFWHKKYVTKYYKMFRVNCLLAVLCKINVE